MRPEIEKRSGRHAGGNRAFVAASASALVALLFLVGCASGGDRTTPDPDARTIELPPVGTVNALVVGAEDFPAWDAANGPPPSPAAEALAGAGMRPASRFDRAVPGAAWEIADGSASGETAKDGTFTVTGVGAGECRIRLAKTVDGNLLDAELAVHVGTESGTAVLVEMSPLGYRVASRYVEAGALVEEATGSDGSSRTARGGRLAEITLPGGATYADPDGDGILDECAVPSGAEPGSPDAHTIPLPPPPSPPLPGEPPTPIPCPGGPIERVEITSFLPGGRLFVGRTAWLQAMGYDRAGYPRDVTQVVSWVSSHPAVAEVDAWGALTGKEVGSTRVSASLGDIRSKAIDVVVAERPPLVRLVVQNRDCGFYLGGGGPGGVEPPVPVPVGDVWYPPDCVDTVEVGGVRRYSALGELEDGFIEDVTDEVHWAIEPPTLATMAADGTLTAATPGHGTLVATLGSVSSTALELKIVAEPTLVGIEIYTDYPIPVPVPMVERAEAGGGAEAVAGAGDGSDPGNSGGPAPNPTPPGPAPTPPPTDPDMPCPSWTCVPFGQTVLVGDTIQFHALGRYDTGRSRELTEWVDWSSSHPVVGLIGPRGALRTILAGETEVRAALGSIESDPFEIRVVREATVLSLWLDVEGTSRIVKKGGSLFLHATASYDVGGLTRDVTNEVQWIVSDPARAELRAGGELRGKQPGPVTVRARIGGVESPPVDLEVWTTSDLRFCDETDVNRAIWSDGLNRVLLETDCASYARGATVAMRYTIEEVRPNPGAVLDPCLDLYVYRGDEHIRTLREDGCGRDILPVGGAAPPNDTLYQALAFWDQKDAQGHQVAQGKYRIVGRFYIYYDPVVDLEVEVK